MTDKTQQQADAEAERVLGELGPLRELSEELRTYPLKLLRLIGEQYAVRGGPVPDHALKLTPYLGDTTIRALVGGGYLKVHDDTHMAVHAYTPTDAGLGVLGTKPRTGRAPKKVKA